MTREIYLEDLANYLKRLPKTDFDEVMAYFTELFDEAGSDGEAELIASLGSPREAAADITGDLLDKKWGAAESSRDKISLVWFAVVAILAAPIGFPLMITIFTVILTAVIFVFSMLFALYTVAFSLIAVCIAFLWESIVHFQTIGILLFNIGGTLISLGLGLLLFIGTYMITKLFGKWLVMIAKKVYRKVKKNG
ncbi:DUF1700 domain-containing protein [Streptococcus merionis]|uniref:Membrane protein n=1 Tax=Streptococcus merionis TaxID=400065 RepID=A0A239SQS5_9STRE|nr:DUF1700 domain-containing protein [Streptococcus merionis]SNU87013.1 membrane protein [Streptococcus merionis]